MPAAPMRGTAVVLGLAMALIPLAHGGGTASAEQATAAPAGAPTQALTAVGVPSVALTSGQRLGVQVRPAQKGPGAWTFSLQRKSGQKWLPAGRFATSGDREVAELAVPAGTYRVLVPAQHGLKATVSGARRYTPEPTVTLSGGSRLATSVKPVNKKGAGWTVTLERKTAQGWARVRTARTDGISPVVSAVDAGTYRVRTKAMGRFPALTSKPFAYRPQAPAGPVDYAAINGAFPGGRKTRSLPTGDSGGCGSVMSKTSEGLEVATGFLSLIPAAGGALAAVTGGSAAIIGAAGASAGSACVQAQFAAINAQLAFQESQIASLQAQLQATTSAIIQGAYVLQSEVTQSDAYDYDAATGGIQDSFNSFMIDGGFWIGPQTPNPAGSVQATATTSADFYTLASFASSQSSFNANVQDASGAVVSCSGALVPPANPANDPNCYTTVARNQGSAAINLDKALATQLSSQVLVNLNSSTNIVPLFDQYNQGLAAFYQQSVNAMQQAFMMEYTINQLNYFNGSGQINSLGQVPGTFYSFPAAKEVLGGNAPTAAQQASLYNRAQKALAQVYSARVNQLYLNTIGFIVSDAPIAGSQSYPTDGRINGSIDYANSVGQYVTSAPGVSASTPLGMLPAVATAGASWTSSAALYQYSGLRNVGLCAANLQAYNQANGPSGVLTGPNGALNATTCPSILTAAGGQPVSAPQPTSTLTNCTAYASPQNTAGGSCYDGNSLVPYSSESGAVSVGSAVINNLMLCDDSEPTLVWFQVGAASANNPAGLAQNEYALTCGNWGQTGSNKFPASTPNLAWSQEATVPAATLAPDPLLWPLTTSSYGGGSYVIDSGYYYSPLTAVPSQLLKPPVNIGGPGLQTAVGSKNNNFGANITFPNSSTGTCSVIWMGDSSVDNSVSNGNCNLYFFGVTLKCTGIVQQDLGCANYSSQYTSATIGVRLPNAATGSLDGGFVLPMTIGTFGGYPITLAGSTYCAGSIQGSCTLVDMWVQGKTTIAGEGFTTSCPTVYDPQIGINVPTKNSYGLNTACSVVLPDGGQYQLTINRTANGTGSFQAIPVTSPAVGS